MTEQAKIGNVSFQDIEGALTTVVNSDSSSETPINTVGVQSGTERIYAVGQDGKTRVAASTVDIAAATSAASSASNLVANIVGIPLPWGSNTIPDGFLLCNGAQFSTTFFPALAKIYTSGTLPDLRGMFIRGLDPTGNVDNANPSPRTVLSYEEGSWLVRDSSWQVLNFVGNGTGHTADFPVLGWDRVPTQGTHNVQVNIANPQTGETVNAVGTNTDNLGVARPKNIAFNYIVYTGQSLTPDSSSGAAPSLTAIQAWIEENYISKSSAAQDFPSAVVSSSDSNNTQVRQVGVQNDIENVWVKTLDGKQIYLQPMGDYATNSDLSGCISGSLGKGSSDVKGASLYTNAATGKPHYTDANGKSVDLATDTSLSSAISAEISRAENAESQISASIANESARAKAAEAELVSGTGFVGGDLGVTHAYVGDGGTIPAVLDRNGTPWRLATRDALQQEVTRAKAAERALQQSISSIEAGNGLINKQVFRAAGNYTYTPTAGTKYIIVKICGAGGGGGGTHNAGSGYVSLAFGGCGGTYAETPLLPAPSSPASVAVGAGGAGGVGFNYGGNGGVSSFGSLITCPGGPGGGRGWPMNPYSQFTYSNWMTPSNAAGNVLLSVSGSGPSPISTIGGLAAMTGSSGGGSFYGEGAAADSFGGTGGWNGDSQLSPTPPIAGSGQNAFIIGTGGAGALSNGSGDTNGGNGADGIVIVEEYA